MDNYTNYTKHSVRALLLLLFLIGCAPQTQKEPFVLKPYEHPEPVYCFDGVDHIAGSIPYIMGGTCFHTPTQQLMDQYHADGKLLDMTLDDLLRQYKEREIHLSSREHQNCNNLCEHGPHVLKGGHCMVPPTPGTTNYEEIRYGLRYMKKADKKK